MGSMLPEYSILCSKQCTEVRHCEARSNLLNLRMQKGGWVYIITNKHHTVLYTGVSSNLVARIQEHKSKVYPSSFTSRYNVDKLIYYCLYDTI